MGSTYCSCSCVPEAFANAPNLPYWLQPPREYFETENQLLQGCGPCQSVSAGRTASMADRFILDEVSADCPARAFVNFGNRSRQLANNLDAQMGTDLVSKDTKSAIPNIGAFEFRHMSRSLP